MDNVRVIHTGIPFVTVSHPKSIKKTDEAPSQVNYYSILNSSLDPQTSIIIIKYIPHHPTINLKSIIISKIQHSNIVQQPQKPPQALSSNSLVNLKAPKLPERVRKRSRVLRHVIRAGRRTIVHLIIVLRLRSEFTAQVDIGNDILVPEVRGDVAFRAGEVGQRGAPG